ncbi:MAG TPA: sigma-70 family RNA polymerase sigma factor [Bryobacteraceae bacterium]|jgi:RNA polymerase sigma-70 factor (ECF subfamily)|nr:sigma-70 family RNA polymerase sigma factor [Bryobacteraceae bacterium]
MPDNSGPGGPERIAEEVVRLYEEYGALLIRYAYSLSRDREQARDAAQVCFFRYFLHRKAGGKVDNAKAWLLRVVRQYVMNGLRESTSKGEAPIGGLDESAALAVDGAVSYEQREALSHIPRLLSPRELQCVHLRQQGSSYEEIAEEMGISQGTVGALLARALKKLRKALQWL